LKAVLNRGYESQFATNHLGHFQLALALLPALRAAHGARVVDVTSGGHRLSDIRWDDPHVDTGYDPMLAYGQSKTANVLFAVELDRRWAGDEMKTPQQGASTSVFAATSPLLADIGGVYLKDNDISLVDTPRPIDFGAQEDIPSDVVPLDPESARRLCELSERLLARESVDA
jgi:NAD(P)-dependent dehydrogenase (short-subunit alcohol dehydrogenase family)